MQEILSVAALTAAIKNQLESRFSFVCVQGEISNFKEQASGHLYFTLKDQEAQISAVLFRGNARSLTRMPKGGDQVIVKGELSVYAPRGNYQILVRELQYTGVGELLLKLHELKTKLEQKGWFDPSRKKALPKFPRTIGVVTSPTGAVIQDIINVLTRRFSGFHLILNPVKVQGEGAAAEIAQAIEQFNRHKLADIIIVGRGGGSLEDLWAFNEEVVAAAIFASEIPIISAVGHETDFSIADYVADLRAPTPSAAAEMAIGEKAHHLQQLSQTKKRILHTLSSSLREHRHRLEGICRHPFFTSPYALLGKQHQLLDNISADLIERMRGQLNQRRLRLLALQKQASALKPTAQIQLLRQKLHYWEKSLAEAMRAQIQEKRRQLDPLQRRRLLLRLTNQQMQRKKERLQQLLSHLSAIDPRNLLKKGYCILFSEKKDSVILSVKQLHQGQQLPLLMQDGEALVSIKEIPQ